MKTNEEITNTIATGFPELEFYEEGSDFLNVFVPNEQLLEFIDKIRNDKDLLFDYMFCLTCVDWPDHFQMVYHLESSQHGHRLVVKVKLNDKENPKVETLSKIYRTAELHEREVYDLFGVRFINHPDLRRLFLTDDWIGHPLRKDYVDEINIIPLK